MRKSSWEHSRAEIATTMQARKQECYEMRTKRKHLDNSEKERNKTSYNIHRIDLEYLRGLGAGASRRASQGSEGK